MHLPFYENVEIVGYGLIRADLPSNTKRGGVCTHCKYYLAFRLLDVCYLDECINFEMLVVSYTILFLYIVRLANHQTF